MALDLARQAVSAHLGDAQSHIQEASILLAAGDRAGSQAATDRALKLAPTDVAVVRRSNYCRALSERGVVPDSP